MTHTYTYYDYGIGLKKTHAPETFYVCEAEHILEADEKLLQTIGVIASKEINLTVAIT